MYLVRPLKDSRPERRHSQTRGLSSFLPFASPCRNNYTKTYLAANCSPQEKLTGGYNPTSANIRGS